jgi:hypothetical protein
MSSSLANIYLGLLESQICQQLLPPVLIYKRYMDDIFILFDNENNSLNTFLSFLQCHNPSCHFHKFTRQIQNKILSATISPEEDCVSFTLLIQNSSKSSTKIHVKIIHISPSVSKCQWQKSIFSVKEVYKNINSHCKLKKIQTYSCKRIIFKIGRHVHPFHF